MSRILVIARTEFINAVMRPGYLVAVLGLPLLLAAVLGITVQANKSRLREAQVAVVDPTNAAALEETQPLVRAGHAGREELATLREGGRAQFVRYTDEQAARSDLSEGKVTAVYVVPEDFKASGKVTVYTRQRGLLLELALPGEGAFGDLLRVSLARESLGNDEVGRLLEPAKFQEIRVHPSGTQEPMRDDLDRVLSFLLPMSIILLFAVSIFLTSNYLLQGTAEEKENRVIESLLSIARPGELLGGKLLGLGAAGLLQVGVYVLTMFIPAMLLAPGRANLGSVVVSLVFFILGFGLFASLMAAVGMVANSVREGTQLATMWTIVACLPLILLVPISQAPMAPWVRALSFFPLTGALTTILRANVSQVPVIDLVLSAASLVGGIALSLWGGARIFRVASLMTGAKPDFQQILRWLREP